MDFKYKNILNFGALLSGSYILYSILVYLLNINIFGIIYAPISLLLTLVLIFVFLLIGTKKYRNIGSEGYINYSKAFVHSILIGIFASIVIGIFNFIFYEIVGPEYLLGHINKLMATLEQTGNIPTEKLDETYQKLLSEAELPAYRQGIKTIIFWIITSGFISLIIGAIVKKTKPLFD